MLLLTPGPDHPHARRPRAVALFGVGLIGRAVLEHLRASGDWTARAIPFPWIPGDEQDRAYRVVHDELVDALSTGVGEPPRLDVVWAAGRAGFSASRAETDAERRSFEAVTDLLEAIHHRRPESSLAAHLVSSGGGLFEGQTDVTHDSVPRPLRAYGELKLAQERALAELPFVASHVYRPSSVYGTVRGSQRRGLIPTLVLNGILRGVTPILGSLETLRDYVYFRDVGEFVARQVGRDDVEAPDAPYFLTAGKPTSLYEVVIAVESLLRRKVYLSLDYSPANRRDISFSPRVRPDGWSPVDVHTGIRRVYDAWGRTG